MTTQKDVDEAFAAVMKAHRAHEAAWATYSEARHAFAAARKAETDAGRAVERAIEKHTAALNALGAPHAN